MARQKSTRSPRKPAREPARKPAREDAALARIADALELLAPARQSARAALASHAAHAFVWHPDSGRLEPIKKINRVKLELLQGVERQRDVLLRNTRQFAEGLPANNALLWGARGMGKSSLIKAVHATVAAASAGKPVLALVEIHRDDIQSLPRLLSVLREAERQFLLFCDDLSFDPNDSSYKSLKAVLEGGIEGRPENVLFYATSNRRHLMPREMIENERQTGIHPGEAVEEKVSLSDRFGLWLGFHACDQETYLAIVEGYARAYRLPVSGELLRTQAHEWAMARGARSGRVAWQFIQDLAGQMGRRLGERVR